MAAPTEAARATGAKPGLQPPVPLYLTSFLLVGLALGILGPALSELRERSGAGIGGSGVVFVGQSSGYIIGAVVAGRLYDRFPGHRVFGGALVLLATGFAVVPSLHSVAAWFVAFVLIGIGASTSDVGSNTLLIWQLGENVGRWMSALHLCFGVGALTAPLFVYAGLSVTMRIAAIGCLALALWAQTIPAPTAPPVARDTQGEPTTRLLALLALFFVLYVGLEIGYVGWIFTYGEEVEFSELAATWLTSCFWIAFTFGRLLSSLLADRLRPNLVLVGSCSLALVAATVLLVGDGRPPFVWTATAMMGLATAPQFPVMLTYLERRIRLSGRATSWFVCAAGIGGLVFPWLVGRWIDYSGAVALPLAMLVIGSSVLAAFGTAKRRLGG